jgi:hypothetical protein
MAQKITQPVEGWSQAKQRDLALFFDQHRSSDFPDGRSWWCYIEKSTGQPVGELQPHGWAAPWVPEAKYLAMAAGTLRNNRFRIDYQRQISDYTLAMQEYYKRAVQEAAAFNLPIPNYGEACSYKLRMIIGEPPKSPKIPEAALAGDPWILGFSKEVNEELRRLLYTGDNRLPTPEEFNEAMKTPLQPATAASPDSISALAAALTGAIQTIAAAQTPVAAAPAPAPVKTTKKRSAQAASSTT